jgi:hypothetical protein
MKVEVDEPAAFVARSQSSAKYRFWKGCPVFVLSMRADVRGR